MTNGRLAQMPDQGHGLGRRGLVEAAVVGAVLGAGNQFQLDERAAQEGGVAEEVPLGEVLGDLAFAHRAVLRQARPERPKGEVLDIGARGPGGEAGLAIEMAQGLLDAGQVGLADRVGHVGARHGRGAQVLQVAETCRPREDVHQTEVAGFGAGFQVAMQAAGEGREVLDGEGKGGAGHHILVLARKIASHRLGEGAGE